MGEVPLALLWHLPDGTTCLLLKDLQAEKWEIRVARGTTVLRSERFASALVAMEEAKQWRTSYGPLLP